MDKFQDLWADRNDKWLADLGAAYYSVDCLASRGVREAAEAAFEAVKRLGPIPLTTGREPLSEAVSSIVEALNLLRTAARNELRHELGDVIEPDVDPGYTFAPPDVPGPSIREIVISRNSRVPPFIVQKSVKERVVRGLARVILFDQSNLRSGNEGRDGLS